MNSLPLGVFPLMPEALWMADDCACPGCGEKLTGATPFQTGTVPKPGDLSLCCNCGAMLQFIDERGHVNHLPASVFKSLPLEERKQLARVQAAILAALKGGRL